VEQPTPGLSSVTGGWGQAPVLYHGRMRRSLLLT